ncbi:hypothetical protein PHYSODRAFT_315038 [Phytophthora sojae]|uniref:Uncharacterized protein n=1 Tax=Phytophthora sojae (strain P6497) TaxID=1094619 RepID=G4ZE98_PHYSP|nr:hypothetical protein PHYSODRAFT_315038 [Phytophthora sojae]EGZ17861.1 hypothetical protein PHYSODRAFT_315038 [Phytophthora sojae]|eukprot:XP_009526919.1 hypothetical protein PHYSODRAFT_315038 [Phytophthora sojae]
MEEDEDTYGFGSFSELFDAGASQATKRLDLGALSRFCMSERLLSRFQQQQRRRDRRGAIRRSRTRTRWSGARRSCRTSPTTRRRRPRPSRRRRSSWR